MSPQQPNADEWFQFHRLDEHLSILSPPCDARDVHVERFHAAIGNKRGAARTPREAEIGDHARRQCHGTREAGVDHRRDL